MGFELREIDSGDSGTFICSPDLEVSGTGISEPSIVEITEVSDGYTRKDSIIKLKLGESIIGDDDVYSVPLNNLYEFRDSSGNTEQFDITSLEEDSGVTIISVYGRTTKLTEFFGALTVGAIEGFVVEIGIDLKVSQIDKCGRPMALKFFNVSTSGISITLPNVDFNFVFKWKLRYRTLGTTTWNQIESTQPTIHLLSLLSGTIYEADASIYCSETSFSDYSEVSEFITL